MECNTVSYIMSKRDNMISFRVSDDELIRLETVTANALKRNPHLKKAFVYRELFGVIDTGMITAQERAYLKGEGNADTIAIHEANAKDKKPPAAPAAGGQNSPTAEASQTASPFTTPGTRQQPECSTPAPPCATSQTYSATPTAI